MATAGALTFPRSGAGLASSSRGSFAERFRFAESDARLTLASRVFLMSACHALKLNDDDDEDAAEQEQSEQSER